MNKIQNPHDRFFKEIFTQKAAAQDFLQHYIPENIIALLELSSLQITKDSFVDNDLQEHFSDLLYQVNLKAGNLTYIYVLFEHKSHPDPLVALQLLRYMVRIWEQSFAQQKILSPIFPIVFYHGSAEWQVSSYFHGLFECPIELEPFLPQFRYWLCDLSHYSNEELSGIALLQTALYVLKYISNKELPEHLPKIFELLHELINSQTGLESIESVLRYLMAASDIVSEEVIKDNIQKQLAEGEKIMATIAEKYFNEGLVVGEKKGVRIGILDSIELDLTYRFGEEGQKELIRIKAITEINLLRQIQIALKKVDTIDELRHYYPIDLNQPSISKN